MPKLLSLKEFSQGKWSFIVYHHDKVIFRSQASDLKPVIAYKKRFGKKHKKLIVYDKIVGRATALLLVLLKPAKVLTPLASQGGVFVLKKYKIKFDALKTAKYLMGVASGQMCQWEKLAQKKTPLSFWNLVKKL